MRSPKGSLHCTKRGRKLRVVLLAKSFHLRLSYIIWLRRHFFCAPAFYSMVYSILFRATSFSFRFTFEYTAPYFVNLTALVKERVLLNNSNVLLPIVKIHVLPLNVIQLTWTQIGSCFVWACSGISDYSKSGIVSLSLYAYGDICQMKPAKRSHLCTSKKFTLRARLSCVFM